MIKSTKILFFRLLLKMDLTLNLKVDIKRNFDPIGVTSSSSKNNFGNRNPQLAATVASSVSISIANKSLPTNTGSIMLGDSCGGKVKKAMVLFPNNKSGHQIAGAPLPPLRQKALIIKDKVPPPVPPRGSPRSTGGSTSSISNRQHNLSHSSVRSSKDSLRDAGCCIEIYYQNIHRY